MLRIQHVILELVREVAPIAQQIARHDSDLARQLRRALSSVPLNIAEGLDQRGARRASHYSIALGSAREAWAAVSTAAAWGYISNPSPNLTNHFNHVIGAIVLLMRQLAHRQPQSARRPPSGAHAVKCASPKRSQSGVGLLYPPALTIHPRMRKVFEPHHVPPGVLTISSLVITFIT